MSHMVGRKVAPLATVPKALSRVAYRCSGNLLIARSLRTRLRPNGISRVGALCCLSADIAVAAGFEPACVDPISTLSTRSPPVISKRLAIQRTAGAISRSRLSRPGSLHACSSPLRGSRLNRSVCGDWLRQSSVLLQRLTSASPGSTTRSYESGTPNGFSPSKGPKTGASCQYRSDVLVLGRHSLRH